MHPRARVCIPARGDPPRYQAWKYPALAIGRHESQRLRSLVSAAPRPADDPDHRRGLARLHVSGTDPDGRRYPPDRYLFAGRGDVSPPHRPAALRGQHAGGTQLCHSQHGPGPAPLLYHIVMKAIEKDPAARHKTWLEFGKELSQAFTTLRLSGASASDSQKFHDLRDMPFFEDFDDVALWEVVRIGSWKTMNAGTVIIREADQGDSFYFLIAGEVAVTLLGKQLNTIKPGGCFGEILYFAGRTGRRTTTITAVGEITVMEIKADALRAATDACQVGFNKAFMRVLVDRLTQANLRLAGRG